MERIAQVEIGQLKFDVDHNLWVATLMLSDTEVFLGAINLHACKKYPELKEDFMVIMKKLVATMMDDLIDKTPVFNKETMQ